VTFFPVTPFSRSLLLQVGVHINFEIYYTFFYSDVFVFHLLISSLHFSYAQGRNGAGDGTQAVRLSPAGGIASCSPRGVPKRRRRGGGSAPPSRREAAGMAACSPGR